MIVSRHVIEHVPNPVQHLSEINAALPTSWAGRLFLETPAVEWILQHGVVHDFFYEHCNYFSADTLRFALGLAGFETISVETVAGGQYLWIEATRGTPKRTPPGAESILAKIRLMRDHEVQFMNYWKGKLAKLSANGNIAIWGAGAKGVTFVEMIDPDLHWITMFDRYQSCETWSIHTHRCVPGSLVVRTLSVSV